MSAVARAIMAIMACWGPGATWVGSGSSIRRSRSTSDFICYHGYPSPEIFGEFSDQSRLLLVLTQTVNIVMTAVVMSL